MPKPLLLAACNRAISDQNGNLSLIDIINGMTIESTGGESVPADAQAMYKWYVVAVWLENKGDRGKAFEQRVRAQTPNGKTLISSILPFTMTTRACNNIVEVRGFPAGRAGILKLMLDIREASDDAKFRRVAEYEIEITLEPPTAP